MSRDQRAHDNWALLYAQQEALARRKELHVVFCLVPDFPGANLRHYLFLLKGLSETARELAQLNITFTLLEGSPPDRLPHYLYRHDAHLLIGDFDPLRIKRSWQKAILAGITLPFIEVDAHNIIPAWLVSTKKEFGAYTIRPKINRLLGDYLVDFPQLARHPWSAERKNAVVEIDVGKLARSVSDRWVGEVDWIMPGETAARKLVAEELGARLANYAIDRNDPCKEGQSGLSPYLHFGQQIGRAHV
jgi:deoxyribodipyrimidine photo-lyase